MKVPYLSSILLSFLPEIWSMALNPRIIGGSDANPGEFPHQVSLQIQGENFCGGSILNKYTVLTAAHCVHEMSIEEIESAQVIAGITTTGENGQRRKIQEIIIHEYYDPDTFICDIAIVKVDYGFHLGELVRAISLRVDKSVPGEVLTLSGFGLTSYPGGKLSFVLQWLNVEAIDLQTCARDLQSAGWPVTTGNVCTIKPYGKGACQGDSGGPLIDKNGCQVGILSWGIPCAKGIPDVFTSVAFFKGWIQQYL